MLSIINLTILFLWIISALSDYIDFAYIWQLKEYRLDRFKDLMGTEQGRLIRHKYNVLWRSVLAILFFFWPLNEVVIIKYFIIAFLLGDIFYLIYRRKSKTFRRPKFTKKAILIIISVMLLEGGMFILKHDWVALIILLVARFFLIAGVVYVFNIFTNVLKKIIIKKATRKLKTYKNLKVIGITGSYGKTTVKKFLDHMLSQKFKVVSTPRNINTEIGVANFILKTNFSDKEIFIVEMGAYTEGDIKLICDMVKPTIGILTAINEQHISLFGDIRKTQKTKYELLRSLPKDGLAITNMDNKYCIEFLDELDCQVATFGMDESLDPTIFVKDIQKSKNGAIYTIKLKDREEAVVESNMRGSYNVTNVMPCVLVASYLKIDRETIIESTKNLPQTIKILQYGNCKIIDDSYNSNPDGFKAKLDYMNNFKTEKRRIIITRGMLELGDKSDEIHETMAGEIAYATDELVITRPDFVKPLKKGAVGLKYHLDIKTIFESNKLLKYIKELKNTNSVILLENKMPSIVMNEIINNSKEI